jgi:hypothetical protein
VRNCLKKKNDEKEKFHLLIFDLKVAWKEYMNNQLKML